MLPPLKQLLKSGTLWAMALSGLSIVFAVAREWLIVNQLGWSSTNDALQTYLTMIYGISLLNEAVRLSAINILQGTNLKQTAKIILPFGAFFAFLATGLMFVLLQAQSIWLSVGAVFSGFLNMVMILLVTTKQRGGSFWRPHLISLMPNVVLLPGILIVGSMKPSDPVIPLALLYYTLPVIQIALLFLVPTADKPEEEIENPIENGRKVLYAHSSGAAGNLVFQGILRSFSLTLGEGEFSKVSTAIRIFESIRYVFVDTIIGRKLKEWKSSSTLQSVTKGIKFILIPQVILTILTIGVAITMPATRGAIIILILSIGSFGMRMMYFMLNSATVNRKLAWQYGLQDLIFAILLSIVVWQKIVTVAILIWLWYMLKPLGQMLAIKKSAHQLVEEQAK